MINIVFVHHSTDMYGSDRSLLYLVQSLDKKRFNPIVLLPREGPLLNALCKVHIKTHILPLAIVGRLTLNSMRLCCLPFEVIRSVKAIDRLLGGTHVDIVHSNTLAVWSGAIWARKRRLPHVWSIREIIVRPKLIGRLFSWLVRFFSTKVVCNSFATKQWLLDFQPILAKKSEIIWNGLDRLERVNARAVSALRGKLILKKNGFIVALVGRINRLKGQKLLVEAAELLWREGRRNIHYLIVGSAPPGQEHFKCELLSRVATSPARAFITVMDFRDDIWTVWDACDIAVVPSTEPESFGLAALEAMAARKPLVAAAHGGIKDIVVDGKTGILFEPGNHRALADSLAILIDDEQKRYNFGKNGFVRSREQFSLRKYVSSFESVYSAIV